MYYGHWSKALRHIELYEKGGFWVVRESWVGIELYEKGVLDRKSVKKYRPKESDKDLVWRLTTRERLPSCLGGCLSLTRCSPTEDKGYRTASSESEVEEGTTETGPWWTNLVSSCRVDDILWWVKVWEGCQGMWVSEVQFRRFLITLTKD